MLEIIILNFIIRFTKCTSYCTDSEDLNFADIERFVDQRKLDNDVSEAKCLFIDVSTLDTDCGSVRYSAWILTTQSVFPQNRCVDGRMVIGQSNDEIIRPVTCK